jgi:transposase
MKHYIGIDLHSNNHFVSIIDDNDNRIINKRLKNNLASTLKLLTPYKTSIESIAIESTFNWYWLADGLIKEGYDVKLVNTIAVQQYSGLKHTDDKSDAFWIAHLLRLGILPTGYIYPPKERAIRDLLRKRLQLVEDRTRHILRIKSQMMRSCAIHISTKDIKTAAFRASHYLNDHNVIRAITADMACIDILNEEIDSIEQRVLSQCRLKKRFKLLTSVPGIGPILAVTIMLETGDITRFAKVGNFSSYCRCVSAARFSNGKKKSANNTKNGNQHLSRAFTEAAFYAARFYDKPKQFFQAKEKQVNRTLATKSLAHKLAKACYYVMRDQVMFDQDKLFV